MSKILRGAATRIFINGNRLAGETRMSLSLTMKTSQYSSFSCLDWQHVKTLITSWSLEGEGLLDSASAAAMTQMLLNRQSVSVSFTVGSVVCSGSVIPVGLKFSAPVKGFARWSISLQGNGPIDIV